MATVWNYSPDLAFNGQNNGWSVLSSALADGTLQGGTTTLFHVKDGQNLVTIHGNFVLSNGAIVSGTITSFDAFYGNGSNKLLAASGFAIDFNAFSQALSQFQASNPLPMYQLILGEPITANGSDYPYYLEFVIGGYADDQLFADAGSDLIYDFGGSDEIYAGPGDDAVVGDLEAFGGVPGDDAIYGGDGDDEIDGGGGDDFISGGPGKDTIDGGDGSDTADYSEKTDRLKARLDGPNETGVTVAGYVEDTIKNIENLNGGSHNDVFTGDGYANTFVGNGGRDKLKGKNGDDGLFGMEGKDRLNGGKDADVLSGGLGKDVLRGGPGPDTFLFDVKAKARNADKVLDFRGKDMVALEADVFTGVNDSGKLKAKYFVVAKEAQDKNDHLVYHDGVLGYDRDGSGGKDARTIATFKGDPHLSADDIIMV
ncbi:MAG: hypothetical protein KDJ88_11355 [Bauldia sp.]|nr:hypothetical protein [Bauldia sp.]